MHHITFGNSSYHTALLIKSSSLNEQRMQEAYLEPLRELGYDVSGLIGFSLTYDKKKPSAACRKDYLSQLLPVLVQCGVEYLVCADGEYFKTLTKNTKSEPHIGHVLPCAIKDFENLQVVYVQNYQGYFYNPDNKAKTQLSLEALVRHSQGDISVLGSDVLQDVYFPSTEPEIDSWLETLQTYPSLTCDIETTHLKFYAGRIYSIAFSWDQHSGVAFLVNATTLPKLKNFFELFQGNMKYHNASFDISWLIFHLWMDGIISNQEGLLKGLEITTRDFDCTKVISYLATNSCAGNHLSLKDQAHEFAGNYAQENIKDVTQIPVNELLTYNLTDTCSTWFVYNKRYPEMVRDNQLPIYVELLKPALIDVIQMQLTGIAVDMQRTKEVSGKLQNIREEAIKFIKNTSVTKQFILDEIDAEVIRRNAEYKKKVIDASEAKFEFNLNSNLQLTKLLYGENYYGLPVIDTTPKGNAAVGADTLKKLIHHTDDPETQELLNHLVEYIAVDKLLGTFIKQYLNAPYDTYTDSYYLMGSFNIGGTVSGRLSSSDPNLQNQPSTGSKYAKLMKSCFTAPEGWIVVGLDFNSLEDYISALTTKDPNKLRVYEQGYDGHCLRAAYYFADQMEGIDLDSPESVNSIKKKYPDLRQDSKAPTFALTYQGTWNTLVNNLGMSEEMAKAIEANYHELYKVSDQWVQTKIDEAAQKGYIEVAFGLRVRTPLLHQVILGNSKTPHEAEAEGRTAGNALGQSYGLLNTRAGVEFMRKVRASKYKLDIKPMAHIHDAQYFLVRDNLELLEWMNEHLVKAVQWQELPEIQHDTVKLGGDLSIFYPSWADEIEVKNGAKKEEIKEILQKEAIKRLEK